jgi:hypothetical protein
MKYVLFLVLSASVPVAVFSAGDPTKAQKEEVKEIKKELEETKEEVKEAKSELKEIKEETKEAKAERNEVSTDEIRDRPKSLFSFGTDGFGWSGLGSVSSLDKDKTTLNELRTSEGKFNLNYHYIFSNGIMLGPEISFIYQKTEGELQNGDKATKESRTTTLAISLGYNFNRDLFNSWWIKGALGGGSVWTESEDTTATPQKTNADSTFGFASIEAGKRLSFESWGLKNFSYSPSIRLSNAAFGGDAKDEGLKSTFYGQLNILKFDLLF